MKNLEITAFVRKSLLMYVVLTGFLSLSACNNKSDGGGVATAPNVFTYGTNAPGTCAGCFTGAMGNIYRTQMEQNGVNVDMTFWGDTTKLDFNNLNYPAVTNYVGSVQMNGFLEFKTALGGGVCAIPAGRYDLRTLSAGMWNMGSAKGGQLQASIPGATLNLTLDTFVVGPRPAGYQDWISVPRPHVGKGYIYLIIQSVNNNFCNMTVSVAN